MADYFTQFSEVVPNLTAEEEAWLRRQLEVVHVFGDRSFTEEELPDGLKVADADWSGHRLFLKPEGCDAEEDGNRICEYEFQDDDRPARWGRHLWLYTEESGDPESVADLVQKFLKRFRPDQCWVLTFACTCSKPRVSSFGGGAVFVTADEIRSSDGSDFVNEQQKAFDSRRGKA
jgi:hypothetical protein